MADEAEPFTQFIQWSAGALPDESVIVAKDFTDSNGVEWVFDHKAAPAFLLNDAVGGVNLVFRRKGSPPLQH